MTAAELSALQRRLHAANVNMIANPATNLMLQGRLDDYPKRRGVTQVKELLAAYRPPAV